MHEIMHAVGHIVPVMGSDPIEDEPSFEDEALVELGFGFEHAVSIRPV